MFIVNVEGAVYREGKWLMITRSLHEENAGGTLSLAGGKVEPGDGSVERTIQRELFEEVGIEIKDEVTFVYSSTFQTEAGSDVINLVFLCEYADGTATGKSPEEVDAVHWLTYEEIMNHPKAPPWTRESIRRAEQVRRS